jgi:hypothetical protein
MPKIRTLAALAATAASLGVVPSALAHTDSIGNANGDPMINECVAMIDCTYIDYHNGRPSDVIKHSGTLTSWTVNAGSSPGTVQLRVLEPTGHHHFKVVFTSKVKTANNDGKNTFSAHVKVKSGEVLALSNDTSELLMVPASSSNSLRFYMGSLDTGWSFDANMNVSQLRLLLSAKVKS